MGDAADYEFDRILDKQLAANGWDAEIKKVEALAKDREMGKVKTLWESEREREFAELYADIAVQYGYNQNDHYEQIEERMYELRPDLFDDFDEAPL